MLDGMKDPQETARLPVAGAVPADLPATSPPTATAVRQANPFSVEGRSVAVQPKRSRVRSWIRSLILLVVLAIPLIVLLVMGAVYWQARTDETRPVDAIVVLGAAQYNGRPSAVLRARLDHAFGLYEGGYAPLIVLTGGRAEGDAFTEAEAGAIYLEELGVPSSAMVLENDGRDTWSSMRGVDTLLNGRDVESLLIVSDGFHLFRSELMARELGYEAWSSPADDSPIRPWSAGEVSYVIRETGGIFAFIPSMF